MIEILSNMKQSLSIQQKKIKLQDNRKFFQENLDKSISQQILLQNEIKEKNFCNKEKIQILADKLENIKNLLKNSTSNAEQDKISNIENIISFFNLILPDNSSFEEKEELFLLVDFFDDIFKNPDFFLFQTTKLSTILFDSLENFSLLLENSKDIFFNNDYMNHYQIDQFDIGLKNLLFDIQSKISKDSFNIHKFNESNTLEGKSDNILLTKQDIGNFELNEQNNAHIYIKDLRTETKSNMTFDQFLMSQDEDQETMTIENIENKSLSIENLSIIKDLNNESIFPAQKIYTNFSSSVNRIEVYSLLQNMAAKASILLQNGSNELKMKLTPPELGQMKLSFISDDSIMYGKIIVETSEAKSFFEQNINNLRETLANAGVMLGQIDVELGANKDFSDNFLEEESFQAMRVGKMIQENLPQHRSMILDTLVDFTA